MFIKVIILVLFLVLLIYMVFYLISFKKLFNMESSGYECGFNYISNTRIMFSYRFFLIGILFLIFDVEIVLLLSIPYMVESGFGMLMFLVFIMILVMGLLYEYYCGSLEWMN